MEQIAVATSTPATQAAFARGTLMAGGEAALDKLVEVLRGFRFRFNCEADLQEGIADVLHRRAILCLKERPLSKDDRPDFLVPCLDGDIAIEVKTKGTFAQLLRQAARYASHAQVSGVLVVGSPSWLNRVPLAIDGTPVRPLRLLASLL